MMTPEQLANQLAIRAQFIPKEEVYKYLAQIISGSLKFHSDLWSEDIKQRAANDLYMKKHPREARARERSAALFLSRYLSLNDKEPPPEGPKTITAEKLDAAGLSDDQIKKLAFPEEEKKE